MIDSRITELTFRPSRIVGIDGVDWVRVTPEVIEFRGADATRSYEFSAICQPRRRPIGDRLRKLLRLPPAFYAVGERDWFHGPSEMFFRWFTTPQITTYMPKDESKEVDADLCFFLRINHVLSLGDYATWDLG